MRKIGSVGVGLTLALIALLFTAPVLAKGGETYYEAGFLTEKEVDELLKSKAQVLNDLVEQGIIDSERAEKCLERFNERIRECVEGTGLGCCKGLSAWFNGFGEDAENAQIWGRHGFRNHDLGICDGTQQEIRQRLGGEGAGLGQGFRRAGGGRGGCHQRGRYFNLED